LNVWALTTDAISMSPPKRICFFINKYVFKVLVFLRILHLIIYKVRIRGQRYGILVKSEERNVKNLARYVEKHVFPLFEPYILFYLFSVKWKTRPPCWPHEAEMVPPRAGCPCSCRVLPVATIPLG